MVKKLVVIVPLMFTSGTIGQQCIRFEERMCHEEAKMTWMMLSNGNMAPVAVPPKTYKCRVCLEYAKNG